MRIRLVIASLALISVLLPASEAVAACDTHTTTCLNATCDQKELGTTVLDKGGYNLIACLRDETGRSATGYVWKAMSANYRCICTVQGWGYMNCTLAFYKSCNGGAWQQVAYHSEGNNRAGWCVSGGSGTTWPCN